MNFCSKENFSPVVSNHERGTILVFTALIAGVICAFLALSVDVGRMYDAKTEKVIGAEQSAIAALQKYLAYDPSNVTCPPIPGIPPTLDYGCRHATKFNRTQDAVTTSGSWNIQTFLGTPHISNVADLKSAAGVNQKGEVLSGRWWDARPAGCGVTSPACPCTDALPCFQACDPGTLRCDVISASPPDNGYASAMRVTFYTPINQKLDLIFGGFMGQRDVSVSYAANAAASPTIATVLPKFTVLLFDLGRNMTVDSHLPWEKEPTATFGSATTNVPERREFAYRLPGACPATPAGAGVVDTTGLPDPNNVSLTVTNANFSGNWDKNVTRGTNSLYSCYTTPEGDSYLVDSFSGATPPEPLRTSIRTLHAFVEQFSNDASPQDFICPVFYDHGLRNVGLSLTQPCFDKTSDDFARLLKLTSLAAADLADTADLCPWAVSSGNCPNAYRAGLFPRMGSFSDLPGAMDQAFLLMQTLSNFWKNDNNVFIFSNGLTNCTTAGLVSCRGYLQSPSMTSTALQDQYYGYNKRSLHQFLYNKAGSLFKSNKIKVHSFLIGKSVLPHMALLKSRASVPQCQAIVERRSRRFLPTLRFPPKDDDANTLGTIDNRRTDNYDKWLLYSYFSLGISKVPNLFNPALLDDTKILTGLTPSHPVQTYYYPPPNLYFSIAAINTQGLYLPIRDLCPALPWNGGVGPQSPNAICARPAWAALPGLLVNPLNTELYTPKLANVQGSAGVPTAFALALIGTGIASPANPPPTGPGIIDKYGRLLCDPTLPSDPPPGEAQNTWAAKAIAQDFLSRRGITLVKAP